MEINWADLLTHLSSAAAQYGMDRTTKYNNIRDQETYYNAMSDANASYLKKLKELYAPELSGELQTSELAARENLVNKAKATTGQNQAQLAQALTRAGVTGGKVAGQAVSSEEKALQDYMAELDAKLTAGADARRSGALATIAQVEGQNNLQQAPIQAQIDAMKQGLGDYKFEDMQQYLAAPLLIALLGGGINKGAELMGKDAPFQEGQVGALAKKASLDPLLQRFGMNTGMLSQQPGTVMEGGNVYKTGYDDFGNPTKEYVGPAQAQPGTQYFNPVTGQYEQTAGPKATPATSYANQIAQIMRNTNLSDQEKSDQVTYIREIAASQGVAIPAMSEKKGLIDFTPITNWINTQIGNINQPKTSNTPQPTNNKIGNDKVKQGDTVYYKVDGRVAWKNTKTGERGWSNDYKDIKNGKLVN